MLIPRTFHMFWDGPPPPDYVTEAMASWAPLHSGWEIRTWDASTGRAALRSDLADLWDRVEQVSPKSNVWQFRTNLVRLQVLHDQGGVWVDADLRALRNVEPLIGDCEAFTSRENPSFVNNGFTGCVQGHPFYADMLGRVRDRVLAMPRARSNRQCGPHLFTETIRRHPSVRVLPTELIYPVGLDDLERLDDDHAASGAFTVHLWHHRRSVLAGSQH